MDPAWSILLTTSSFVGALPLGMALGLAALPEAALLTATMLASIAYHACQTTVFCAIDLDASERADYLLSCSLILWFGLLFIGVSLAGRVAVFFVLLPFAMGILEYASEDIVELAIVILIVLLLVGIAIAWCANIGGRRAPLSALDGACLVLLLVTAFVFYLVVSLLPRLDVRYALLHSAWHACGFVAVALILATLTPGLQGDAVRRAITRIDAHFAPHRHGASGSQ